MSQNLKSRYRVISKSQYYQLMGIRALAEKYLSLLNDVSNLAVEIVGEIDSEGKKEEYGHANDFVYGSRELDSLLEVLGLVVEEDF